MFFSLSSRDKHQLYHTTKVTKLTVTTRRVKQPSLFADLAAPSNSRQQAMEPYHHRLTVMENSQQRHGVRRWMKRENLKNTFLSAG